MRVCVEGSRQIAQIECPYNIPTSLHLQYILKYFVDNTVSTVQQAYREVLFLLSSVWLIIFEVF